ncbi:hypothetical protein BGZ94_003461 [Podila epigama]|nr:hypothetical protein BGZ94_003461 [Podila epigama]
MDGFGSSQGVGGSSKVWSNAVNTLLNAMESILLDEELQPLWPREHHGQDSKKKSFMPATPPMSYPHDPTFSPPLKRKKDPLPSSERSTKTQRMTDHLTAQLASSLHVSSSSGIAPGLTNQHHQTTTTGLENRRGFHRVHEQSTSDSTAPLGIQQLQQQPTMQIQGHPSQQSPSSATTETAMPRKYKKAIRTHSNPTTPISSHPPSPGTAVHVFDDPSSSSSAKFSPNMSGSGLDGLGQNLVSSYLTLDPRQSSRSSLFMRRESRSNRATKAPHHLAQATRLALFHRILSTTRSVDAQTRDMDVWLMEQAVKRGFSDRQTLEAALTSHVQTLIGHMMSLGDRDSHATQYSNSGGQDPEFATYGPIQQRVDAVLECAQWLCGAEFEMGINRICPQWLAHEQSIEQLVHYVQVVESMRETVSGRFQHPQELSEDLARCQEVVDYQRTLFGETLRNHGLEWRALGLPPMEGLIQQTQDWILNMARTLTVKMKAEVNLVLEQAQRNSGGQQGMDTDEVDMNRAVVDIMDLVLQGALFTGSCLELAGKQCPMLVTAWTELAGQYCYFALTKRKELVLKSNHSRGGRSSSSSSSLFPTRGSGEGNEMRKAPASGVSRGLFLRTMELFEKVSRLLQCLMEMHEEEEALGGCSPSLTEDSFGGVDDDEQGGIFGASAASSDQDEAMIGTEYGLGDTSKMGCDGVACIDFSGDWARALWIDGGGVGHHRAFFWEV